jgi:glutamine synthetase
VICWALNKEGDPLPYDAGNVLNRVIKRYQEKGLEAFVALEMEFYLLDPPKLALLA